MLSDSDQSAVADLLRAVRGVQQHHTAVVIEARATAPEPAGHAVRFLLSAEKALASAVEALGSLLDSPEPATLAGQR